MGYDVVYAYHLRLMFFFCFFALNFDRLEMENELPNPGPSLLKFGNFNHLHYDYLSLIDLMKSPFPIPRLCGDP